MPWSPRRVSGAERQDLITNEAYRLQLTRKEVERKARSERGLTLPDGTRLIFDGSYQLLTPVKAR
jgi:hypothetical protein